MTSALTGDRLRDELLRVVPDEARVSVGESIRAQHGEDLTYHRPRLPDAVVFPVSTAEVTAVLSFANERRIPVVPFGTGTSLEGHVIPVAGGISLDMTRMDAIVAIRTEDLTATVEPGVMRNRLNAEAGRHGLFFPVDPGADASLGGMAATNASGTTTVRYGGMRQQVLALEVVLADGTVLHTGSRAIKTSAGYNLTGLFVGSEGTLGVITELTVRLYGIAEYAIACRATFPDVASACRAAIGMVGAGVLVTRLEFLDGPTIGAINAYKKTSYPEEPSLLVEFTGSEVGVAGDLEAAREVAEGEGCTTFVFERDPDARRRLWEARHHAAFAVIATAPHKRAKSTDVCVPVSELPGAIEHARRTMAEHGIEAGIGAHAGDGNYHVAFMVDPEDPAEVEAAERVNAEIVDYALARGGTCTGEHGIGLGKREYLSREHGDLVPFMRGLKALADPNGILNPGKVLP